LILAIVSLNDEVCGMADAVAVATAKAKVAKI
jgi:hypothetical protein